MTDSSLLLHVQGLKTYFSTASGVLRAVDDLSFTVKKGEVLGIVGESGCGKTVAALSLLQLVNSPPGFYAGGKILFKPRNGAEMVDILKLEQRSKSMRKLRGKEMSMIFQDPMNSFSPFYTLGKQMLESMLVDKGMNKRTAQQQAIQWLSRVGIRNAEHMFREYPHKYSGGMLQRAMLAFSLLKNPQLLIADEPTTALDVTIQAQILRLLKDLRQQLNLAILIITHDLGIVADIADRVLVMYAGKAMETADVETLFFNAAHPYTQGLLRLIPRIGNKERLQPIPGTVYDRVADSPLCSFLKRCPVAKDICFHKAVPFVQIEEGHMVRCWLYGLDSDTPS